MKSFRPSGFSLIEVLIAIVVLAVLAILGVSAMQGISSRRDAAVCQSNLRQVYLLLQAYLADHSGHFPPAAVDISEEGDRTLHWKRAILPYMGKDAGGSGTDADVFHTGLVCPAMNRDPRAKRNYSGLCNFALTEMVSDPAAPLQRGIPMTRIRKPSRFLLMTESSFRTDALPRESIKPKDFNSYNAQWNYHDRRYQHLLFADGHIEVFPGARRLIMSPYMVNQPQDVWTP